MAAKEQTEKDIYDKWLDQMAQPGYEGGITGKRTRIKAAPGQPVNTASGRWQITDKTRNSILRDMGLANNEKSYQEAVYKFQNDPEFERNVARHGLLMLDKQVPANASDGDRVRMLTKGWYTGNVNHPDDVVPNRKAGNKIKVGDYANKVVNAMGLSSSSKSTTPTTSGSTVTFNPTANNSKVAGMSQIANQGVIPDRTVIESMPKLGTTPLVKKETPQTPTVVPIVSNVKAPPEKASNLKKVSDFAMDTTPYLSNLYSATMKPPATPSPMLNAPMSLQRVSMDVDRTQLESDYRDALRTSDLADVSTSVRAKLAAKAQKFDQMSKINETERNANLNISNKEREVNTSIDMANRQALYNKQLQDVERENAIIAQKTANVSNISDKMIAQQARKDQQDLELQKTQILANSDTFGNLKSYLDSMGGEKHAMGGKLYTAGRFMKTLKPIKTIK